MDSQSKRILVVEDDILIAIDIQSVLETAGHSVIGPVTTVSAALDLVARDFPDIALLDIKLGGSSNVFDLADFLGGKHVQVLFLTGYSRDAIPQAHRHRLLIPKPYLPSVLLAAIAGDGKEQS